MKKQDILQAAKIIVLALVIGLGTQALFAIASTWYGPTCMPPGCNTDTPLNVGNLRQEKIGGLVVATGNPTYGFAVLNGNVGIGTVTPTSKLDILGIAKADDFCLRDGSECLSDTTGTQALPRVIVCHVKTDSLEGQPSRQHREIGFSAANCGGTKPTSAYTGMIQSYKVCWGVTNIEVLGVGEGQYGPSIRWYGGGVVGSTINSADCQGNAPDDAKGDFKAVYIKK